MVPEGSLEGEEWRPVPSVPGILASSLGRIWLPEVTHARPTAGVLVVPGRIRVGKTWRNNPYRSVSINKRPHHVHRLVCEAFWGAPAEALGSRPVVMHLDDDKANNIPVNLRWGTSSENSAAVRSRRLLSEATRKKWQDPGYRERACASMRAAAQRRWDNPSSRSVMEASLALGVLHRLRSDGTATSDEPPVS